MSLIATLVSTGVLERVSTPDYPILGRTHEVRLLIEYLCHQDKKSVLLVGPRGSGRRTIVEGLVACLGNAQKDDPPEAVAVAAAADVVDEAVVAVAGESAASGESINDQAASSSNSSSTWSPLIGSNMFHLSGVALASKAIANSVALDIYAGVPSTDILFISNAAESFMEKNSLDDRWIPRVAQGELRVILSVTPSELAVWFNKRPACFRNRFQILEIAPLSASLTRLVLNQHVPDNNVVSRQAVGDIVVFADRVLATGVEKLPGSAFRLLHQTQALVVSQQVVPTSPDVVELQQRKKCLELELAFLGQDKSPSLKAKVTKVAQQQSNVACGDDDGHNDCQLKKLQKNLEECDHKLRIFAIEAVACEYQQNQKRLALETADRASRHRVIAAQMQWEAQKRRHETLELDDLTAASALEQSFGVQDKAWHRASICLRRPAVEGLLQARVDVVAMQATFNQAQNTANDVKSQLNQLNDDGRLLRTSTHGAPGTTTVLREHVVALVNRLTQMSSDRLLRMLDDADASPPPPPPLSSPPSTASGSQDHSNNTGNVSNSSASSLSSIQARPKQRPLAERLRSRVVGQDEAIDVLCAAVARHEAGLARPNQPIAGVFFAGSTGVGKTELAKALALEVFETEQALVRFDMSEFEESHSISRLIGSPPGYLGFDDGGQLTNAVMNRPRSVILLDEIEKSHPKICTLFLQVLDDARLTSAQGETVSFRETIVIFTSNTGSASLADFIREHSSDGSTIPSIISSRIPSSVRTCRVSTSSIAAANNNNSSSKNLRTQPRASQKRKDNPVVVDDGDSPSLSPLAQVSRDLIAKLTEVMTSSDGISNAKRFKQMHTAILCALSGESATAQDSTLFAPYVTYDVAGDVDNLMQIEEVTGPGPEQGKEQEQQAPVVNLNGKKVGDVDDHAVCWEFTKQLVRDAIRERFPPEFLNRFEDIIVFNPLRIVDTPDADGSDPLSRIVQLQFKNISERLQSTRDIHLTMSICAATHILREAYDPQFGARPLLRYMEKRIVSKLSQDILEKKVRTGMRVHIQKDPLSATLQFLPVAGAAASAAPMIVT